MSFTPTTIIAKEKHFAFLSKTQQTITDFEILAQGVSNFLFNGNGFAPVYLTAEPSTINTSFPMAGAYIATGIVENIVIDNSYASSTLIVNDTLSVITIKDYNNNTITTIASGQMLFAGYNVDYFSYKDLVPFGFCTEDLAIKESKADELNLSHVTGLVQSKNVEVTLPGFNVFENNSFFGIPDAFSEIASILFSEYNYIYIVNITIDESKFMVYEINTNGNTQIEINMQANQPNKGILTFKKECSPTESLINMLYYE